MPTAADLVDKVQTGDLILCHGTETSSRAIEWLTDSPYSHAAMIVRLGSDRKPFVWEEAPQSLGIDPDHNNQGHGGAQLGPFEEIIEQFYIWEDVPYWRPLVWDRPVNFDDIVAAKLPPLDGIPFDNNLETLLHWAEGRLNIPAPRTSMDCSELVALTYQQIGLLPEKPPMNWYSPGSFGGSPPAAPLQLGATLGDFTLIDRASTIDLTKTEASAAPTRSADPAAAPPPQARTT
jgi:hypothetical protein